MERLPFGLSQADFSQETYHDVSSFIDTVYYESHTTYVDALVHTCLEASCRDLEVLLEILEVFDQKYDGQVAGDLANILCNPPHHIGDGKFTWQISKHCLDITSMNLFRNYEFIKEFRVHDFGRFALQIIPKRAPQIFAESSAVKSENFTSLLDCIQGSTVRFYQIDQQAVA